MNPIKFDTHFIPEKPPVRVPVNDNIGVGYTNGIYSVLANGLKKEFTSALEAKSFVDFIVNPIPKFFKYELKNEKGQTLLHTNDWNLLKHWYARYSGRKHEIRN